MMSDLGHTPGIYYAVAYFLSCILYASVNKRRYDVWRTLGIVLGFFALTAAFMVLTDGVPGWAFVPCMAVVVLLLYGAMRTVCVYDWKKTLYFTVRAFILGELVANLEWQLFYYGVTTLGYPAHISTSLLFCFFVYLVVYGLMYFLEARYDSANRSIELTWRDTVTAVLIGLFVYVLSNLSFATPETPFSGRSSPEIFVIRTLVDLGGVGMLLAHHMHIHEISARVDNEYLTKLLYMQRENYRMSEESVELVNRKYHDLKHQINVLRSGISADEQRQYLDAMYEEIKSYEAQNKTGNKVLDTILAAKSLQCQSEGVTFTVVADGAALDFMEPVDISVLFGNALDNAIESVLKIEDRDKRLIHLSVDRQKSFVRIHAENCCEGEVRLVGGMPETTKDDRGYHGFGVKSIKSIVEKYSGSMKVKAENGWFELSILMPVPEEG